MRPDLAGTAPDRGKLCESADRHISSAHYLSRNRAGRGRSLKVDIFLSDRRFKIGKREIARLAAKILARENRRNAEVNIVFCRDSEMFALNSRFKGRKRTTDVLAFSLSDSRAPGFIGEVYVNLQQAQRQAADAGVPYNEEVMRLTVHGIMHLLGYRDHSPVARKKMWARQESYLNGEE